ncbi:aluminum-activated malate transporter 10-like [Nicotiana sylvestris]|uniref:Aluminum-activated malate transporter 10-like n=1 Tax=Nicotiana sylvestris TaxID=4096 RepID=A0A1U7W8C0_NICSY|nr:PREDICTED: aluminum-activated malate transporter 10-like [Nicotiana sylvestris]
MNAINTAAGATEWRIRMSDGSSAILPPESSLVTRIYISIKSFFKNIILIFWRFLEKAWIIGMNEPRKVIHCIKVGIALSVVSLFYYMKPLYEGVGGTAMWAVLTVVVVFEYTVGATLYKCLNRAAGTSLAGFLAIGIHWIANQSGKRFEPIIMGASIFILASAATFSRFIPAVKARFDYGAMIFILTFTLVSISGYRVENLLNMAHERVSTIIIGASLCVITSILIFPIWAGEELHKLVISNLEKQAESLDCCVTEYFSDSEDTTTNTKKMLAYKCVLNSKASEETMANFARWEPAHGHFNFQHPWKYYLKISALMRSCACCIEALTSCINQKDQASEVLRKQLNNTCQQLSSSTSEILKELAMNMKTMRKSSRIDILIQEKNSAIQELETQLKQVSGLLIVPKGAKNEKNEEKPVVTTGNVIPMVEIIPAATFASLVIEIAMRIEGVVDAVEELSKMAKFKIEDAEMIKQSKPDIKIIN